MMKAFKSHAKLTIHIVTDQHIIANVHCCVCLTAPDVNPVDYRLVHVESDRNVLIRNQYGTSMS